MNGLSYEIFRPIASQKHLISIFFGLKCAATQSKVNKEQMWAMFLLSFARGVRVLGNTNEVLYSHSG